EAARRPRRRVSRRVEEVSARPRRVAEDDAIDPRRDGEPGRHEAGQRTELRPREIPGRDPAGGPDPAGEAHPLPGADRGDRREAVRPRRTGSPDQAPARSEETLRRAGTSAQRDAPNNP